jgi:CIC family chloride channel protein
MSHAPDLPAIELGHPHEHSPRGLLKLAVIAMLVGSMTGLVCGSFRHLLVIGDRLRNELLVNLHAGNWAGFPCIIIVCAAATAMAAWIVRRFEPFATGSGIPHVEAVLNGQLPSAPPRLLIIKYIGGLLALGAGLALGREGPSVQMGATISHVLGKVFKLGTEDCLLLLASGAGAGLSVAFNAPIAGAVFVLEELTRRFDTRTAIATFGASAAAISLDRTIFGDVPDFFVHPLPPAAFGCLPISLLLGAIAGVLGVAYNRTLIGTLEIAKLVKWPVEARAAAVGGALGLLAWFAPTLVGGGDNLTQQALVGTASAGVLIGVFLLRFALGPVSYAAGTPGGIFAPMLVLGSQSGLLFGNLAHAYFPSLVTDPVTYAVTGIAAFFAAVVRAPLTGIILAIELTGSYTQLLPMLAASFTAMLIPTLMGNPPIYDSLKIKK